MAKLPHGQEVIDAAQRAIIDAKAALQSAEQHLAKLRHENAEAERAAKVAAARRMTPTMRAALERMAAGGHVNYGPQWGSGPRRYSIHPGGVKLSAAVFDRLTDAGFIKYDRQVGAIVITQAGRLALAQSATG